MDSSGDLYSLSRSPEFGGMTNWQNLSIPENEPPRIDLPVITSTHMGDYQMKQKSSSIRRQAWHADEDLAIQTFVSQCGLKWIEISERLNRMNLGPVRTGKQCRTRYAKSKNGQI
jgi:hypothetical protein